VHAGAALGALDGAGWINTALSQPWAEDEFLGALPRWLAGFLPEGVLASALRAGTVIICTAIPAGLCVPRLRRTAARLALVFYTLLYLALGSTEVVLFAGAIAIAQISCLKWPRSIVVVWPRACGWPLVLRIALDRYDFEQRTDWPRPPDPDAELEVWFDQRHVTGPKAIISLLLFFPMSYFALLAVVAGIHAFLPRTVAVSINCALVFALLGFSTYTVLRGLNTLIRKRPRPTDVPASNATAPTSTPATNTAAAVAPDVRAENDTPRPLDR
jgi:hypothetical protein